MNHKLHNTLFALTASGALLVVSLIVAAPLTPGPTTELHAARTLAQAIGSATQTIESSSADSSLSTRTATGKRQHTLAMPFFSFLPRG